MVAQALANAIKSGTQDLTDPGQAVNAFWKSVCNYVEANAEVIYGWAAVNSVPSPDPVVTWTGTIITAGSLSPCGESTPAAALSSVSASMNANIMTWTVKPAAGFTVSGPTITAPAISLQQSGATDRDAALLSIASDIIKGIQAAIPPVMAGAHGAYTGATTGGKIL